MRQQKRIPWLNSPFFPLNGSMVGSVIFIVLDFRTRLTTSFSSTRILNSQWRRWVKLKRLFLHVARYAWIDLPRAQTSLAVAAALKKHRSSSLTLRTNGTSPCAMAATVTFCPPQRSKAKHNSDYAEYWLGKSRIEIIIMRYLRVWTYLHRLLMLFVYLPILPQKIVEVWDSITWSGDRSIGTIETISTGE